MSSLADRLRGVLRQGPAPSASIVPCLPPLREDRPDDAHLADVLGGTWSDSETARYLVVDRTYRPGYRLGHMVVADVLPSRDCVWPSFHLLTRSEAARSRPASTPEDGPGGRLLFIDLETTGLAGGAGTYAFLVGCGWFDGGVFRTRQYFLSDYAAERTLLEAVAAAADRSTTIVSYNGRSFDLPLIETRFLLHRMDTPFGGMPHLDMLHTARSLWRAHGEGADGPGGCRLVDLEHALFGHHRDGDVPGFEIPSRYFHFVRSGDARPLAAVLEHNRLDILSLALLTARAARLLEEGPGAATTAREALGLGRLYERSGLSQEALDCFARAGHVEGTAWSGGRPLAGDTDTRACALRAYAVACRRLKRFDAAAAAWRALLDLRGCSSSLVREAMEALAVHHEHRLRDVDGAKGFARRSLDVAATRARRDAIEHRLARLDRKSHLAASPVPLF